MEQKNHRIIKFLGGKTPYYLLGLICLSAVTIFLLDKISFVFQPLFVVIATVLPPIICALIIYYLFNPLVNYCHEKKIPRGISIAALYTGTIVLVVFAGMRIFDILQQQTMELIKVLPSFFDDFQNGLKELLDKTSFGDQFDQMIASLDKAAENLMGFVSDNWMDGAKGLGNLFSAVSTTLIALFTGPIIAFFLLKNPRKFYHAVLDIIPPGFRKDFNELVKIADQQIGAFLKGQIISSLILGAIYWVVFLLIGLEYASVIAVAAGLLCIVPYIGPFVAFIPGLFIAFHDSTFMVVKFVVAWFVVQLLHGDLVVPRVMGDRLKMHPITILVVLLVMGNLFGLVGVVFGIPIYCFIKLLVTYLFRRFKKRYNRFFADKGVYRHTDFSEDDYL